MLKTNAVLTAVGGYVPETVLDNYTLEKMVDTSNDWILSRTGIKERRILTDKKRSTSDMAALAIQNLIESYALKSEEVDCLILATSTPDTLLNPTATIVCQKAGLVNAWGFDMNAACSGFLYALSVGASFIEGGRFKKILVVGADQMSAVVNYEDRNTCVLFGDGAGVVLLEASDKKGGIQDYVFKNDASGATSLSIPAGGSLLPTSTETLSKKQHFIQQDGKTVFRNAINGMSSSCLEVMQRNNLRSEDIDWIVPHQANLRIINALSDSLNFPIEKVKINIEKYGNTTAATIPLCLWDFKDDFKIGDKIVLTAFGAGFTWGATLLEWSI